MGDVVCRQLGFPHGSRIDPLTAPAPPPIPEGALSPYSTYDYDYDAPTEEPEEPVERFWLNSVTCNGPESQLVDCNLGQGFLNSNEGCRFSPNRIHIACRKFAIVEALEAVTTPGAGTLCRLRMHSVHRAERSRLCCWMRQAFHACRRSHAWHSFHLTYHDGVEL